jgi:hypothetical protein
MIPQNSFGQAALGGARKQSRYLTAAPEQRVNLDDILAAAVPFPLITSTIRRSMMQTEFLLLREHVERTIVVLLGRNGDAVFSHLRHNGSRSVSAEKSFSSNLAPNCRLTDLSAARAGRSIPEVFSERLALPLRYAVAKSVRPSSRP